MRSKELLLDEEAMAAMAAAVAMAAMVAMVGVAPAAVVAEMEAMVAKVDGGNIPVTVYGSRQSQQNVTFDAQKCSGTGKPPGVLDNMVTMEEQDKQEELAEVDLVKGR